MQLIWLLPVTGIHQRKCSYKRCPRRMCRILKCRHGDIKRFQFVYKFLFYNNTVLFHDMPNYMDAMLMEASLLEYGIDNYRNNVKC